MFDKTHIENRLINNAIFTYSKFKNLLSELSKTFIISFVYKYLGAYKTIYQILKCSYL